MEKLKEKQEKNMGATLRCVLIRVVIAFLIITFAPKISSIFYAWFLANSDSGVVIIFNAAVSYILNNLTSVVILLGAGVIGFVFGKLSWWYN